MNVCLPVEEGVGGMSVHTSLRYLVGGGGLVILLPIGMPRKRVIVFVCKPRPDR